MSKKVWAWFSVALMLGTTFGCSRLSGSSSIKVGPLQRDTHTLELDDATLADIQLLIGMGELTISPGTDKLIQGTFSYNVAEWKPEIEQNRVGDMTSILIKQGETEQPGLLGSGARNEWEIGLSQEVPLRLMINQGVGDSQLDLSGVRLTRLQFSSGTGDTRVIFNEPNPEPMQELYLTTGTGSTELRSVGNASPEQVEVTGGAGDLTLDFGGAWQRSANIEVNAGVGKLVVYVPREIGVKVSAIRSAIGGISIEGLKETDEGYVNDVYGTANLTLDISLKAGVGEINVIAR